MGAVYGRRVCSGFMVGHEVVLVGFVQRSGSRRR